MVLGFLSILLVILAIVLYLIGINRRNSLRAKKEERTKCKVVIGIILFFLCFS